MAAIAGHNSRLLKGGDESAVQQGMKVQALVATLTLGAVLTLIIGGPLSDLATLTEREAVLAVVLVGLIVVADFFDIDLPISSVRVTVSVSSALCFASALSLEAFYGAVVAATGALLVEIIQRRSLLKLLVNVSNYALATFVAGWVYHSLANPDQSPIGSIENIGITVGAAAVYTVLSTWSLALVLSQVVGTSPWRMWRANMRGVAFEGMSLPTLGSLVPVLYDESPIALIVAIIPLLGPYLAFKSYRQIYRETRTTIELLADMLDRRDPYTWQHSQRVTQYAAGIMQELDDLSIEEREAVLAAARIHDLGKIGTDDSVLQKPGKLTDEERKVIEHHVIDGADILLKLSMYHEAAGIVRSHHERWDGKGYPDGLKGEQIPIGARIIAVADTYDAMTSDRVYRSALPEHIALAEIRRCAGTQFDPEIAAAFERSMLRTTAPASAGALQPTQTD